MRNKLVGIHIYIYMYIRIGYDSDARSFGAICHCRFTPRIVTPLA